jgi:hypothetical protein
MRAALWSFEAFKVMLIHDQADIARAIGLIGTVMPTANEIKEQLRVNKFVNQPYGMYLGLGYNYVDEDQIVKDLVEQVWNQTKAVADQYYGKQFVAEYLVDLVNTDYYTRYPYRVVNSTFDDNTPSVIRQAISDAFQDSDGGYKAYAKLVGIRDTNVTLSPLNYGPGQTLRGSDAILVGLDLLDPSDYLLDGQNLYVSINARQNDSNLTQIIVDLPQFIYYKNYVGKTIQRASSKHRANCNRSHHRTTADRRRDHPQRTCL